MISYTKEFNDIKFTPLLDGVQALIDYGAYELSVVRHSSSYGSDKGLYEIGVFDKLAGMVSLPGITLAEDTIKGYLTEEDVSAIMKKMETLTTNEGVQIAI